MIDIHKFIYIFNVRTYNDKDHCHDKLIIIFLILYKSSFLKMKG